MKNSLVLFGLLFSGVIVADPIHEAAKGGNVEAVEQQLRHGTNVNIQDELGNTALHYAVTEAQLAVVNVLLGQPKLDINLRNKRDETPLHLAGSEGRPKIAALLIENGAEINARDGGNMTALCLASSEGRPETVQVLLIRAPISMVFPAWSIAMMSVWMRCRWCVRFVVASMP